MGHIWSRGWEIWTQKKPEPPETEEEEERRPQWQRARVRPEDEEREEVTTFTLEPSMPPRMEKEGTRSSENPFLSWLV